MGVVPYEFIYYLYLPPLSRFTTAPLKGGGSIKTDKPIMLAGGIKTENVIEGINIFKPVGVDISSSVETDGFKDEQKIKKFIETVRSYENE